MTEDRPTPTSIVFALVAGAGSVAIAVGAVILLSIRNPVPQVAKTEPPTLPTARPAPTEPAPAPRRAAPAPNRPRESAPAPQPARVGRLEPDPAPHPSRYKVGTAVEQEVVFTRRSVYRVQGIEVTQAAEYTILSDLVVTAVRPDGGGTMTQTIRSTRLGNCDPTLKQDMQAALEKTHGTTFELAVGPDGDVIKFTGPNDAVNVQVPNDPGRTATFRVWSLLDAGAWTELAGLTLLQPPPRKGDETWDRPIAHDWGPLGGWDGRTSFRKNGKQLGQDRIDFTHSLTYRPPAAGAGQDLPLRIVRSEFRNPTASGSVLYDVTKGRITRAEETFQVRGRVTVSAITSDAVVDLEERQDFQLTVREPAERNLKGVPKR